MTKYDYSALELIAAKPGPFESTRFLAFVGGGIVLVVFIALFSPDLAGSLIPFYFAGFGISIYLYEANRKRTSAAEALAYGQFAAANGLIYHQAGPATDTEPGTLFRFGDTPKTQHQFAGQLDGFAFRMFTYKYMTGSGKSRAEHEQAVLVVDLLHAVPHLVIDSIVEPGTNNISVLPIEFSADQRLRLEGDFENYFAVYSPEGQGVSALTLLAPDVMQTIMHRAAYCDIEFVRDRLYMYWPGIPKTAENFRQIFETLGAVLDEVGAKLKNPDALAIGSGADLTVNQTTQPMLRRSGSVLNTAFLSIATFIFFVVFSFATWLPEVAIAGQFLLHGLFVVMFIYVFWQYRRKYQAQAHYEKYYGKKPKP